MVGLEWFLGQSFLGTFGLEMIVVGLAPELAMHVSAVYNGEYSPDLSLFGTDAGRFSS
jgi:hypothetical protein